MQACTHVEMTIPCHAKQYLLSILLRSKQALSGGSVFVDLFLAVRIKLYYLHENEINPRKMDFENENDKEFSLL